MLKLSFPDVKMYHTWSIENLPWGIFRSKKTASAHKKLDPELLQAIEPHVQVVSSHIKDEHTRQVHQKAASAFLYILLQLCDADVPTCQYTLRSTIPIASGLGSSASISVCISIALLTQAGLLRASSMPLKEQEDEINKWAFVGELCIHGNPSGIDNTVATRGNAVKFRRNVSPGVSSITPIDFPTIPLLLVDTNQPRSTGAEVAKVGDLKSRLPAITNPILDSIGAIAEKVHSMISNSEFSGDNRTKAIRQLGQLVRINQDLLASLGVSHPKIEKVRQIIDQSGLGYTKLTGGGGGGCVFTVIDPHADPGSLHAAESELEANGFSKHETLLGARGVAMLNIWQDSSLMRKITEKAFLGAPDSASLEAFIGLAANHEWHFWSSSGPEEGHKSG